MLDLDGDLLRRMLRDNPFFMNEIENDSSGTKKYVNIFENMQEVSEYIRQARINKKIFDEYDLDSENTGIGSFHDFYNFKDAFDAFEYGTDQYFDSFNDELKKVDNYIKKYSILDKISYKNDMVGFAPIVPNCIIGNPINMVNQTKKERHLPSATIIFEKAINCGHNSNEMVSFASIIFSLIQVLEKKGIRCEVYISSTFKLENEIYSYKIKIKNFMQPLNLYKMQFPVIASDMFRRIGFRLLETCPYLENSYWKDSYGRTLIGKTKEYDLTENGEPTLKLQELLGMKQNDIFIPNSAYFNYDSDDDIEDTIEKIIKRTNFKKYIKLGGE